jgi:23S rRNA pseudouridine1911/1915/1917 synthase
VSGEAPRLERARAEVQADGVRVDRYLADGLGLFSRSQARQRVVEILVNGLPARLSRRLKTGDTLEVAYRAAPAMDLVPEDIPLRVVYEDEHVLVIDKQQGLVVHPACGHPAGTLVNALLWRFRALRAAFGPDDSRPGIVHRLDKDTSGVMVVAKDPESHEVLARQFKERSVRKLYVALVHGVPHPVRGVVRTRIGRDAHDRKRFAVLESGGKPAVTRYRVVRSEGDTSLVVFAPRTGRTHQIRIHARHLGCPVLGDPLYGRTEGSSLMLHAWKLTLTLPQTGERRTFCAPLPGRFRAFIEAPRTRDAG